MTDQMPGQAVDLPLPPELAEALGYPGQARFVGLSYVADTDDLIFDDGVRSGTASTWTFQAYRRHRAVGTLLDGAGIGFGEERATHYLLLDRVASRASIAPLAAARAFLRGQHPPEPALTPEQHAELQRQMEQVIEDWREAPVDQEAVRRALEEQRGRVGRMMSWLDMTPTPGRDEGRA